MTDESDRPPGSTAPDGGTESTRAFPERTTELDRTENVTRNGEHDMTMPEAKREFLLEVVRRLPLLKSLRSGPAEPSDLLESVDMSRSTVHRAINSLKEYDVIEQTGNEYELTGMGDILVDEVETFGTRSWTTMTLNPFLNSINGHGHDFPVEHFVDAKITRRKPRQPHSTIHRITELFRRFDNLRMFSTVISPVYVDVGYREMMDGMQIEAMFDREVVELMLTEFPEKAHETIETGNFDVYTHDGLPFEMFIFDDRVGMAAHNERGNAEVLIESDDPAAIEWAENLYEEHLSNADPLMISDTG